jgi:hypothetical protein
VIQCHSRSILNPQINNPKLDKIAAGYPSHNLISGDRIPLFRFARKIINQSLSRPENKISATTVPKIKPRKNKPWTCNLYVAYAAGSIVSREQILYWFSGVVDEGKKESNAPPVLKEDERECADDDCGVGEDFRGAEDGVPWLGVDDAGDLSKALFNVLLVSYLW